MGSIGNLNNPALYLPKYYIGNYNRTASIVISTWYTVFTLANVEDLKYIMVEQRNTPTLGREHSIRLTIDTEVHTITNNNLNDSTVEYVAIEYPATIATNANLQMGAEQRSVGFMDFTAAGSWAQEHKVGGHAVTLEWRIDEAVQAGQAFYCDYYYTLKELTP